VSRGLSAGLEQSVRAHIVYPIFFLEMDFLAAPVRFTTQRGQFDWDGKVWIGAGRLLSIDRIRETTDGEKATSTFTLSGVPIDLIASVYAEKWHGRAAKLWFGTLNDNGALTGDPKRIVGGIMNQIVHEKSVEFAKFQLEVRTGDYQHRVARAWRQTNNHHKILFPDDTSGRWIANDRVLRFGN